MALDFKKAAKAAEDWVQGTSVTAQNPNFALSLAQIQIKLNPKGPPIRILSFDHGRGAVGYYRVGVPLYYLRKMGLCETLLMGHIMEGADRENRIQALHEAVEWAQVIVVSRPYSMAQLRFITSAKARGKVVVVDSDDHLEAISTIGPNPVWDFWTDEALSFYAQGLAAADHITVAGKGLKDLYDKRYPGRVSYLPNPVDICSSRWNVPHSKYPEHPFTIGIAHGYTHQYDLEIIAEPLYQILEEFPEVRFHIVGYKPPWVDWLLPQDRVTRSEYIDFDNWPRELAPIDLLLCPLADVEFNRAGKTDTKLFEATLAGCATISSPIGEYLRWKPGRDTLHATTTQTWLDSIRSLILKPDKAKELNRNAMRYVLAYRRADSLVSNWYECYREAIINKRTAEVPYGARSAVIR